MTEHLTLLTILLAVALAALWRRVAELERQVRALASPEGLEAPVERRAPAAQRLASSAPATKFAARRTPALPRLRAPDLSFEALVGGRLPIWVGGAALAVAGIFLVRLSIESGLLTPALRVALAAAFALLLLAGAEGARSLAATRDDPRIAQALAGAAVASSYATLYLAAATYHLVAPLAAFVVLLAITLAALGLALRHGAPTAIMALVGGFAAPLVAGYEAAGVVPLLVYLALFLAALLGLAVVRGWTWLALAATACAYGWAGFLLAVVRGDAAAGVAGFIVVATIANTLALPAAGAQRPWLRAAPMVAGLAQLLLAAPVLDFGPLAWAFYLVLSSAALLLAWRDERLIPAPLAALGFVLVLISAGLRQPSSAPLAALLATLVFAGPGHLRSRHGTAWATLAIGGTAGPLLVAQLAAPLLLGGWGWCTVDLLLAAACAGLAWRHRDRADARDLGLVGGLVASATLLAAGLQQVVPAALVALPLSAALALIAAAARTTGDRQLRHATLLPLLGLIALALPLLLRFLILAVDSVTGETLTASLLPPLGDTLRFLALPGVALAALLVWDAAAFGRTRRVALASLAIAATLLAYHLLKLPLAILTAERFLTSGFTERVVITQAFLLTGWALLRTQRLPRLGFALLLAGIARLTWFDLLMLNPAFVEQRVGALPIFNAAVLHLALAAALIWTLPPSRRTRFLAAALTVAAAITAVRQVSHGSLLTGPVGTGENWLYSAAMLGLALFWLWRGIARRSADLRVLGLALLTATTLKVFLIDAAALQGVLRILSFLGLGFALIAIGWAYRRFVTAAGSAPPADLAPA